jgi:hypothetical protein
MHVPLIPPRAGKGLKALPAGAPGNGTETPLTDFLNSLWIIKAVSFFLAGRIVFVRKVVKAVALCSRDR